MIRFVIGWLKVYGLQFTVYSFAMRVWADAGYGLQFTVYGLQFRDAGYGLTPEGWRGKMEEEMNVVN